MRSRVVIAAVASSLVSYAGFLARALSGRGAILASVVGTSVGAGTRLPGVALLGTFFASSSLLSRLARESSVAAKGSRRDARQVVANGGVAGVASLVGIVARPDLAFVALAGSLAAANADTWASEIGSTASDRPRLLLSRREVEPGTSGAVSVRGTAGTVAGAALVGVVAGCGRRGGHPIWLGSVVAASGVAGSLVDSLLGETVQERRYCPACERMTEARIHRCGTPTDLRGGVRGIDNDVVNLACTLAGSLSALTGWAVLSRSRERPARSRR